MNDETKKRTILSIERGYKSQDFLVKVNLPLHPKPPAIGGIIPDIYAVNKYYRIAICVEDPATQSLQKYAPVKKWIYEGNNSFWLAAPGEWPDIQWTRLF